MGKLWRNVRAEEMVAMREKMKKVLGRGIYALAVVIVAFLLSKMPAKAETMGDLTYIVSNGKVTITDCDTKASGELIIPSKIAGYPVTSIGNSAFIGCDNLTTIEIPDSVISLGEYAFLSCSSLMTMDIPDGVTTIGQLAFGRCSSLVNINIPEGVTNIGDYAFIGCSGLKTIEIPDSVTSIGVGYLKNVVLKVII